MKLRRSDRVLQDRSLYVSERNSRLEFNERTEVEGLIKDLIAYDIRHATTEDYRQGHHAEYADVFIEQVQASQQRVHYFTRKWQLANLSFYNDLFSLEKTEKQQQNTIKTQLLFFANGAVVTTLAGYSLAAVALGNAITSSQTLLQQAFVFTILGAMVLYKSAAHIFGIFSVKRKTQKELEIVLSEVRKHPSDLILKESTVITDLNPIPPIVYPADPLAKIQKILDYEQTVSAFKAEIEVPVFSFYNILIAGFSKVDTDGRFRSRIRVLDSEDSRQKLRTQIFEYGRHTGFIRMKEKVMYETASLEHSSSLALSIRAVENFLGINPTN